MLTRRQIRSGSGLPCMGAIRNTGFPRHDGRRGSETGGKVMIGSMQGRVIFMALALLLSVVLTSCGGGLGSTAGGGIGGTGGGPVTGVGSATVDGGRDDQDR